MPPASSTSGGAHGVLSHAMSPVSETRFDTCASTRQSVPALSLRHATVTACLQSMAKVSSTVCGLARNAPGVQLSTAASRPVGVGFGCHG
jgi:hypothetical protein